MSMTPDKRIVRVLRDETRPLLCVDPRRGAGLFHFSQKALGDFTGMGPLVVNLSVVEAADLDGWPDPDDPARMIPSEVRSRLEGHPHLGLLLDDADRVERADVAEAVLRLLRDFPGRPTVATAHDLKGVPKALRDAAALMWMGEND